MNKRAQITIFIILGLLILFVFVILMQLTSKVNKSELESAKEDVYSKSFKKETMRIFVEDCLQDELEKGLILIGKQGRIWKDQPGGTEESSVMNSLTVPGESLEDGGRVFYGISREEYSYPEAYPCNDLLMAEPIFCKYGYPNTKVGFGKLNLNLGVIEEDLRGYMLNRTLDCIQNYTKTNISAAAVIETTTMDLELKILDDGISVAVNYPFKFRIAGEEFFQLTNFDFFYPTYFKKLLDAAVTSPLDWDYRYVNFAYTPEQLSQDSFEYAVEKDLVLDNSRCDSSGAIHSCTRRTNSRLYQSLGVTMTKDEIDGDNLFTFVPVQLTVFDRPQDYKFRIARQNRPPALDFISKEGCNSSGYDYLVVPGAENLGTLKVTASARDPDEDSIKYGFVWNRENIVYSNDGIFTKTDLQKSWNNLTVTANDKHDLNDSQILRVLVDRPLDMSVIPKLPPEYGVDNNPSDNNYFISKEDPVFVEVNIPERSLLGLTPIINLGYKSIVGNTVSDYPLPIDTARSGSSQCYSFPGTSSSFPCDFGNYLTSVNTWFAPGAFNPFNTVGYGQLSLSSEVTYCKDENPLDVSNSATANVFVKECVPYKNPERPYASPYQDYVLNSATNKIEFNPNLDPSFNPFLATHNCCAGELDHPEAWKLKLDTEECFVNPDKDCYGRIKEFTLNFNNDKNNEDSFGGYVWEKQFANCDGLRGNICGSRDYDLFNDELRCGIPSTSLEPNTCNSDINDKCSDKLSYGFIDIDTDIRGDDAWCHGTMGCTDVCKKEVVLSPSLGITSGRYNLNELAKTRKLKDDSELKVECGCNAANSASATNSGSYCDKDFDGFLDGKCRAGLSASPIVDTSRTTPSSNFYCG